MFFISEKKEHKRGPKFVRGNRQVNSYYTIILLVLKLMGGSPAAHAQQIRILTGAEQTANYMPMLVGKKVGVIGNHTSMIGRTHLVDSLLHAGVRVVRVFSPEHGFRGDAGAGDHVQNETDANTGLPIISLYGKDKKPKAQWFNDLDVVVFDIQDVGARFYTFISTLHYAMETAAETQTEFVVLDRPNPHGWYTDGPVLDTSVRSFVGMDRIPIVHGCTIGELATMINGESWIGQGKKCKLKIIPCKGYTHSYRYQLPIAPSPNLKNMDAVYLYPSLCWFEGTVVSVGRGTDKPFQLYGYPGKQEGDISFVPKPIAGVVKQPMYENQACMGWNLEGRGTALSTNDTIALTWLIEAYKNYKGTEPFFSSPKFFDKLAGTALLRQQIEQGASIAEIRKSWEPALTAYRALRKKYLLYPD